MGLGIYGWVGKYGLLMCQIVLGIKLVVPDRVRSISHVVSGSALWVEVSAQTRHYPSGWFGTDPIVLGLG